VTEQLLELRPQDPWRNVRYLRISTTDSPSWVAWLEVAVYQSCTATAESVSPPSWPCPQCPPQLYANTEPVQGASSGTVLFSGWALDRSAVGGTGVSVVQLYLDGPPGTGTLLGTAAYGNPRPDVGRAYGENFAATGWSLPIDGRVLRP